LTTEKTIADKSSRKTAVRKWWGSSKVIAAVRKSKVVVAVRKWWGSSRVLAAVRKWSYAMRVLAAAGLSLAAGILVRLFCGAGWANFAGAASVALGGFLLAIAEDRGNKTAGRWGLASVTFGGVLIMTDAVPLWTMVGK
jgi:hypothetical protein